MSTNTTCGAEQEEKEMSPEEECYYVNKKIASAKMEMLRRYLHEIQKSTPLVTLKTCLQQRKNQLDEKRKIASVTIKGEENIVVGAAQTVMEAVQTVMEHRGSIVEEYGSIVEEDRKSSQTEEFADLSDSFDDTENVQKALLCSICNHIGTAQCPPSEIYSSMGFKYKCRTCLHKTESKTDSGANEACGTSLAIETRQTLNAKIRQEQRNTVSNNIRSNCTDDDMVGLILRYKYDGESYERFQLNDSHNNSIALPLTKWMEIFDYNKLYQVLKQNKPMTRFIRKHRKNSWFFTEAKHGAAQSVYRLYRVLRECDLNCEALLPHICPKFHKKCSFTLTNGIVIPLLCQRKDCGLYRNINGVPTIDKTNWKICHNATQNQHIKAIIQCDKTELMKVFEFQSASHHAENKTVNIQIIYQSKNGDKFEFQSECNHESTAKFFYDPLKQVKIENNMPHYEQSLKMKSISRPMRKAGNFFGCGSMEATAKKVSRARMVARGREEVKDKMHWRQLLHRVMQRAFSEMIHEFRMPLKKMSDSKRRMFETYFCCPITEQVGGCMSVAVVNPLPLQVIIDSKGIEHGTKLDLFIDFAGNQTAHRTPAGSMSYFSETESRETVMDSLDTCDCNVTGGFGFNPNGAGQLMNIAAAVTDAGSTETVRKMLNMLDDKINRGTGGSESLLSYIQRFCSDDDARIIKAIIRFIDPKIKSILSYAKARWRECYELAPASTNYFQHGYGHYTNAWNRRTKENLSRPLAKSRRDKIIHCQNRSIKLMFNDFKCQRMPMRIRAFYYTAICWSFEWLFGRKYFDIKHNEEYHMGQSLIKDADGYVQFFRNNPSIDQTASQEAEKANLCAEEVEELEIFAVDDDEDDEDEEGNQRLQIWFECSKCFRYQSRLVDIRTRGQLQTEQCSVCKSSNVFHVSTCTQTKYVKFLYEHDHDAHIATQIEIKQYRYKLDDCVYAKYKLYHQYGGVQLETELFKFDPSTSTPNPWYQKKLFISNVKKYERLSMFLKQLQPGETSYDTQATVECEIKEGRKRQRFMTNGNRKRQSIDTWAHEMNQAQIMAARKRRDGAERPNTILTRNHRNKKPRTEKQKRTDSHEEDENRESLERSAWAAAGLSRVKGVNEVLSAIQRSFPKMTYIQLAESLNQHVNVTGILCAHNTEYTSQLLSRLARGAITSSHQRNEAKQHLDSLWNMLRAKEKVIHQHVEPLKRSKNKGRKRKREINDEDPGITEIFRKKMRLN